LIDVAKDCGLHWKDLGREYTVLSCGGLSLYVHLRDCMNEVPVEDLTPGDVLLLSIRNVEYPQHLAIFCGRTIVHSNPSLARRAVVEEPFTELWIKRVFAVFRFRTEDEPANHTEDLHGKVTCEQCVRENPVQWPLGQALCRACAKTYADNGGV
jgi:hypothetical protein